jgi:cysteine desulfurase
MLIKPNDKGLVPLVDIVDEINPDYTVVSLQMVNNETGIQQEVEELGQFIRRRHKDIYFHTDAVQALGKVTIDVEKMGVDMMTLSAHKAYGPKGLGCLWVRDNCYLDSQNEWPYLGTIPTDLIIRFASVVSDIDFDDEDADQLMALADHFFLKTLNDSGIEYSRTALYRRVIGYHSLCFPGVDCDELVMALSDKGVYVSAGSACTSSGVKASHVLLAMGIPEACARSTIRVTMGRSVNAEQCVEAAHIIADTVKELRNGSQSGEDKEQPQQGS